MDERDYTLLDGIEALLRRWKMVIFLPLAAGIIAVAIGYAMPKWYRAEAQVMPPYSQGGAGAISGLLGGIMGLGGEGAFTLPMMMTPVDLWSAMVKSPGIADSIIEKFDLKTRYEQEILIRVRKRYEKSIYVDVAGAGILTIGYDDKDPVFSARVTNEIVDLLGRTLQRVHTNSARRTREFVEVRLSQCEEGLNAAEDSLASFQKANRAISLEDQAKVAVENVAQLYAQLSAVEVQVGAMKHSGAQFTPEMSQLKAQSSELRKRINKLEQRGDNLLLGIPIKDYPELILEYARLYRDFKIQELVYEMLRQQYEQARIEEQRSSETLHILARAIPPDKKIRPKKAFMGIGTTFGVGVLVLLWALWKGFLEKLRRTSPQEYQRIIGMWRKRKKRKAEETA